MEHRLFGHTVATYVLLAGAAMTVQAHSLTQVESELAASEPYAQLVDQAAPGFELEDPDGRPVSLAGLRGNAVVLNFIYTRCQEACPLHSALMARVQSRVAEAGLAEQVQFVTVATDTEDTAETAAKMRKHGAAHGLDPTNWVFLHGGVVREGAGVELAKAYGLEFVPTGAGEQIHGVVTHVIDREGRLRARFRGLEVDPVQVMMYAAALAHGDHASPNESVNEDEPQQRGPWLPLSIGAAFATLTLLTYGTWAWSRRRREAGSGAGRTRLRPAIGRREVENGP